MTTNSGGPYRTACPTKPETLSVETDDVELRVYYNGMDPTNYNHTAKIISETFYLKGTAQINYFGSGSGCQPYVERGSEQLDDWLRLSKNLGHYKVNNIIIPCHQVIVIRSTVTPRTEELELKVYHGPGIGWLPWGTVT